MQSYGARLFGNTFLNFVSNFSLELEGGNWEYVYNYDNTICLKWGILNVPFCLIFVPFHFYLIMTFVGPCLHKIRLECGFIQKAAFFSVLLCFLPHCHANIGRQVRLITPNTYLGQEKYDTLIFEKHIKMCVSARHVKKPV